MSLSQNYAKLEVAADNFKRNLDSIIVGETLFYYAMERKTRPTVELVLDLNFPKDSFKLVMKEELTFSSPTPKALNKIQVNAILLSTTRADKKPKAITLSLPDSHPSQERLVALFKKYPEYDTIKIEATYSATY